MQSPLLADLPVELLHHIMEYAVDSPQAYFKLCGVFRLFDSILRGDLSFWSVGIRNSVLRQCSEHLLERFGESHDLAFPSDILEKESLGKWKRWGVFRRQQLNDFFVHLSSTVTPVCILPVIFIFVIPVALYQRVTWGVYLPFLSFLLFLSSMVVILTLCDLGIYLISRRLGEVRRLCLGCGMVPNEKRWAEFIGRLTELLLIGVGICILHVFACVVLPLSFSMFLTGFAVIAMIGLVAVQFALLYGHGNKEFVSVLNLVFLLLAILERAVSWRILFGWLTHPIVLLLFGVVDSFVRDDQIRMDTPERYPWVDRVWSLYPLAVSVCVCCSSCASSFCSSFDLGLLPHLSAFVGILLAQQVAFLGFSHHPVDEFFAAWDVFQRMFGDVPPVQLPDRERRVVVDGSELGE